MLRKWDSLDKWRESVQQRLAAWGFNTIGEGSEEELLKPRAFPYVRVIEVSKTAPGSRSSTGFPDVFSPAWNEHVRAVVAKSAAPEKDNPWLIGYLVDLDLPWDKLRAQDFPKGTTVESRKELAGGSDFQNRYATAYFESIRQALRQFDPNHLYLGTRFQRRLPDQGILAAAGKSCDLLTISLVQPERGRARP